MSAAGVPAGIAATAPSLKKLVAVNGELESVNILSSSDVSALCRVIHVIR